MEGFRILQEAVEVLQTVLKGYMVDQVKLEEVERQKQELAVMAELFARDTTPIMAIRGITRTLTTIISVGTKKATQYLVHLLIILTAERPILDRR